MAKIPRKHQKIFAGSASNNGQFGSAQVGTKVLSTDLDTLQNLAAWANGWNDATISSQRLPTLEEMQGLHYVTTTQIAYLFQEGIPEYNSSAEYHTNSVVKKAGTYELYGSKTNDNTGNALPDGADNTDWQYLGSLADLKDIVGGGNELPVGSVYINYDDATNPSDASLLGYGTWVAMQDRMLIGAGGTYAAGATGGSATTTQTTSTLASHSHSVPPGQNAAATNSLVNVGNTAIAGSASTNSTGSGGAMTTISPYIGVYIWRRTA